MKPHQAAKVPHFHLRHPDGDLLPEPYRLASHARGAASIGGLPIGGYQSEGTEDKAYRVVSVGLRTMCPCKSSVGSGGQRVDDQCGQDGKSPQGRHLKRSHTSDKAKALPTDSSSMRQNAGKKGGEPSTKNFPSSTPTGTAGAAHSSVSTSATPNRVAPATTYGQAEFAHLSRMSGDSYEG